MTEPKGPQMTRWQKFKWFWYWSFTGRAHPHHIQYYLDNPIIPIRS